MDFKIRCSKFEIVRLEGNKIIFEEEGLGRSYVQRKFGSESIVVMKKVRYSVVMVKGEGGVFHFCGLLKYSFILAEIGKRW